MKTIYLVNEIERNVGTDSTVLCAYVNKEKAQQFIREQEKIKDKYFDYVYIITKTTLI